MIRWLKNYMFKLKLKRYTEELKNKPLGNFQNYGKHISILFDESQMDSMSDLQSCINKWKQKGKLVETFSFVDVKEFPADEAFEYKICRKDVSWYKVPSGEAVERFLDKSFDILITINPDKRPHLHFLNAASKAKFKIGFLPDELEFYNLMLDCDKPENVKSIFTDIQSTLDKLAI